MVWQIAGKEVTSRMLLGTARYPSPEQLRQSIIASECDIITVSLRRESARQNQGERFWDFIKDLGCHILPNTAGCHSVSEAISTAQMARELFQTNWIKLEVIGNDDSLQPDPFKTVEAAEELIKDGFEVFPYTTADLIVAEKLVSVGCKIVMPWGAPIGSGRGLQFQESLLKLRQHLSEITLIVDAGLGRPSHAAAAMEMGYDAVLLNTAVAQARDPQRMAEAFALATKSGRLAYQAGCMRARDTASPSTPTVGKPFWQEASYT